MVNFNYRVIYPGKQLQIKNKSLFLRIEKIILECDNAKSLSEVTNTKKLTGYKNYYRIRIGEYRLGIELIDYETVRFILVSHRKDIYRLFPK